MDKKDGEKIQEERNHGAIRKIKPPKVETEETLEIPDDIPSFPSHPPPKTLSMENLYESTPSVSEEDNSSTTIDRKVNEPLIDSNIIRIEKQAKETVVVTQEIAIKNVVEQNLEEGKDDEVLVIERDHEDFNENHMKITVEENQPLECLAIIEKDVNLIDAGENHLKANDFLTLTLTSQDGAQSKTKVAALKKRFEDKMNAGASSKSNDDDEEQSSSEKLVMPGRTFYDLSSEQKKFFSTPKLDAGEVKPSEEVLDVQNPDSEKSLPKMSPCSLERRESFQKAKRMFENNF